MSVADDIINGTYKSGSVNNAKTVSSIIFGDEFDEERKRREKERRRMQQERTQNVQVLPKANELQNKWNDLKAKSEKITSKLKLSIKNDEKQILKNTKRMEEIQEEIKKSGNNINKVRQLGDEWDRLNKENEAIKNQDSNKEIYSNILKRSEAFDDGYQFGDVTKTIGGTIGDVATNVAKGAVGVGQGAGKFLASGVAQVADWIGQDEYANKVRKKIADEPTPVTGFIEEKIQKPLDKYSISGDIPDSVFENIGQMGAYWATGQVAGGLAGSAGMTAEKAAKVGKIASDASMFTSAAGDSFSESYSKEGVKDWQAWTKALGSGEIEMLTENLLGFFGTSGLDTALANKVSKQISSGIGKILVRNGIQATSESLEELLSYLGNQGLDTLIDVVDKLSGGSGAKFKTDWNWEEVGEQAGMAFLSSLLLGGGQTIGSVSNNYNGNIRNAINETARQQDIAGDIENLEGKRAKEEKRLTKKISIDEVNNVFERMQQLDQQIAQKNQELLPTANNQLPTANENNTYTNKLKQQAIEEINNSKFSAEDKKSMLDIVNNLSNFTEQELSDIQQTINTYNQVLQEENKLDTKGNYKNDQARRQAYMKYKNDTGDYNSTVVNEVLDTIPENRNGRRTVKQWLQAANEIGSRISDLSNEEIERIAYKSWFDLQPTKSITQYDNVAKKSVAFQKLTSDEWLNTINNAVNEARANNQTQKTLPVTNVENAVVKESIDTNIPINLIESAKQYNLNYKNTNLSEIQKSLENKGIETRFDAEEFSNENEGAKWRLTRNADGTVTREIILNPNANEKTVVQEMAIHELTHDIVAKNTKTSKNLYNEVKKWLSKDTQYQEQLESLKDIYGENLAEEEAIAKTLQTKFGTQEEINNLVNYNRSLSRKIYDWVVDKLNKVTGGKIEKLYWQDVKNKFERAYSEEGNYNQTATRLSIGQNINNTQDNQGRTLTKEQRERYKDISTKLRDENGNIKRYYHGTQRGDRVGNIFDPNKATSGPMAFFTDNPDIAKSYSENKQDTSLSREYDTEWDLFKANDKDLDSYWRSLSFEKRKEMREKGYNVGFNDDYELEFKENASKNSFGSHYADELSRNGNNPIKALYDTFINGGFWIGEDVSNFQKVLDYIGVENTQYLDPYKTDNKVYEVYLNVKNPFDTSNISKEMFNKLEEASKNAKYNAEEAYSADMWDKTNIEPSEWIEYLKDDIKEGTTHSWTRIPDWVTDVLKTEGYDGIVDTGGKHGGQSHQVVIPFYSEQIKNIDNTNPTDNPDIRYSDNANFDQYLENRIGKQGTRTTLGELKPIESPTGNKSLATASTKAEQQEIAKVLDEPITKGKEKNRAWAIAKANLIDKGIVFEEISRKTKNRELQGKWDYTLTAGARGQNAIGQPRYDMDSKNKTQKQISKSLESIREEVGKNTVDFQNYMYHQLNIDRMSLNERFGIDNKPVFGDNVSGYYSKEIVAEYEKKHPEFKKYAQDVYDFLDANKKELVDRGVISQELSDKLAEMYPHYVPIKRVDKKGIAIKVPLDTFRTGVNTPLQRAKGGNSDIEPLFETIANRTLQTYNASARNNFGLELMNSLESARETTQIDLDTLIDEIGNENTELLKEGKNGENPTFTVFKNGEKTTFEITKDMYDALKPQSDIIKNINNSWLAKASRGISNFRRNILTEYNPVFSLTNAIKDAQDIVMNSQHSAKTYSKLPEAYQQILKKGYWYNEYVQNGGEQNSYFKDGEFESNKKQSKLKSAVKVPFETISRINNVIEMSPRLAEYIASREAGRSIETSMLDAARVTTNFKAGGNITKTLNRNGATFLNASVQGFQQQIRNIQEANTKGLKGYAVLATKYAISGLPALLLNGLIWKDDDDYENLQDYAKDNYYIVAKLGDGKFLRIPKGRVAAAAQKIVSNATEYLTDDNKQLNIENVAKDFWEDIKFAQDNVAPNNPITNNILSPIINVAQNKTWYGGDLIPKRLQDKPANEQYDESTDSLSIWLGDKLNISPYKINYLFDQYGGGAADVLLPKLTKQAENNVLEDKFTTDSVMKNKYPGEYYDNLDTLKKKANSSKATDEDKLRYKYMSSISSDLNDLYKEKREIQNSNMTDKEKKKELKVVQEKINNKSKEALKGIDKLKISGNTATANDTEFYKVKNVSDGTMEWKKITEKEKEQNKNISLKTYADYKNKIADETIKQRKNGKISTDGQLKDKDKINLLVNSSYNNKEKSAIYENYINKDDKKYNLLKETNININEYLKYKSQEFESDKKDDGTINGKTISGSKKNKVFNYINSMPITYMQKIMLYGMDYTLPDSDQKKIVNYINSLNLTKQEKLDYLSQFKGFTIYKNGSFKY